MTGRNDRRWERMPSKTAKQQAQREAVRLHDSGGTVNHAVPVALAECQCEHESHAISCASTQDLTSVRSSWGTYAICKKCRTDHPIPNEYLLPSGEYYVGEVTS